jgi:Uma2 family endonuclease
MKAVMPSVRPEILAWRKRTGADRWDEMWEGVLHMPPMPNSEHQDLEWALETYLRTHWARRLRAKVFHQINVASPGGWPDDYRIPDIVLLKPDRFHVNRSDTFDGGPNVVVEIHSPGDEAREKLGFYAAIGVSEVWIIDRDTKAPEIHVLQEGRYETKAPGAGGWLASGETGLELKAGEAGRLSVRLAGDESTRADLPEV